MDADQLLGAFLAFRAAYLPATGETWRLRKHLRPDHPNACEGPISVQTDSYTGPLSDETPDPETIATASVWCPHCPAGFSFKVSYRAIGDMAGMLRDLVDWERDKGPAWASRVQLVSS